MGFSLKNLGSNIANVATLGATSGNFLDPSSVGKSAVAQFSGGLVGNKNPNKKDSGPSAADRLAAQDAALAAGTKQGQAKGELLFGQTQEQTGQGIQDVVKRRQANLDQSDPVSNAIRDSRNSEQRILGATGAAGGVNTAGQSAEIAAKSQQNINTSLFQNQQYNLNKVQDLFGNIASNQSALELGYGGLATSGQYQAPPESKGLLSSIFG